jgi:transposase InsO family protein
MVYTTNPSMPRVRRDAVEYARKKGVRAAALKFGYSPGAISKWSKKAIEWGHHPIPTLSSRPKSHPHTLSQNIVEKIVVKRLERNRCAEVVQRELQNEGVLVSLPSVKRYLDRRGLTKKQSPWKKLHLPTIRPKALAPGDLVQVDTVHIMTSEKTRIYLFTCIDVYSRWTYARAYNRANCRSALDFLKRAQAKALFTFKTVQSDHGSEFSKSFSQRVGITHRHSRVRTPNDNAHLERFNRTIQEEYTRFQESTVYHLNKGIFDYLKYYNEKRLHLGLNLETPGGILAKCFQGID